MGANRPKGGQSRCDGDTPRGFRGQLGARRWLQVCTAPCELVCGQACTSVGPGARCPPPHLLGQLNGRARLQMLGRAPAPASPLMNPALINTVPVIGVTSAERKRVPQGTRGALRTAPNAHVHLVTQVGRTPMWDFWAQSAPCPGLWSRSLQTAAQRTREAGLLLKMPEGRHAPQRQPSPSPTSVTPHPPTPTRRVTLRERAGSPGEMETPEGGRGRAVGGKANLPDVDAASLMRRAGWEGGRISFLFCGLGAHKSEVD